MKKKGYIGSSLTDEELLAQKGTFVTERDVLAEFYRRYGAVVYGICLKYLKNREESQDATIEIFEQLQVKLSQHKILNFRPWLHVTAKNHCLMKLRKSKVQQLGGYVSLENNLEVVENNSLSHLDNEAMDKEPQLQALESGIENLAEEQKRCVKLFYLDNKSYKEISDLTGMDLNSIKSHIQNGKRNLKLWMQKAAQGGLIFWIVYIARN